MEDNKKLKTLMFGIIDGTNKMQAMSGWTTVSAGVSMDYKSCAQDRRRWKPTGDGSMVPEEEEEIT